MSESEAVEYQPLPSEHAWCGDEQAKNTVIEVHSIDTAISQYAIASVRSEDTVSAVLQDFNPVRAD